MPNNQDISRVVTTLLTDPVALKELKTEEAHKAFSDDILAVLARHCPTQSFTDMADQCAAVESTTPMQDWRIRNGQTDDISDIEPGDERPYTARVALGNQSSFIISDEHGDECLELYIEIDHGVPAVHINVNGGDSLLHIRAVNDGLVIARGSENQEIKQAAPSRYNGNDSEALFTK